MSKQLPFVSNQKVRDDDRHAKPGNTSNRDNSMDARDSRNNRDQQRRHAESEPMWANLFATPKTKKSSNRGAQRDNHRNNVESRDRVEPTKRGRRDNTDVQVYVPSAMDSSSKPRHSERKSPKSNKGHSRKAHILAGIVKTLSKESLDSNENVTDYVTKSSYASKSRKSKYDQVRPLVPPVNPGRLGVCGLDLINQLENQGIIGGIPMDESISILGELRQIGLVQKCPGGTQYTLALDEQYSRKPPPKLPKLPPINSHVIFQRLEEKQMKAQRQLEENERRRQEKIDASRERRRSAKLRREDSKKHLDDLYIPH